MNDDRIHTEAIGPDGDPTISRAERRHYRNLAARKSRRRRKFVAEVRRRAKAGRTGEFDAEIARIESDCVPFGTVACFLSGFSEGGIPSKDH